ncbi:hypothetical protein B0H10DRAFT_1293430 [Mycena sp. CBHHK59/15]|nr:hypothetical protein B0H10DRAFT_1293430 [Mycena sp. CBHHK59/15]
MRKIEKQLLTCILWCQFLVQTLWHFHRFFSTFCSGRKGTENLAENGRIILVGFVRAQFLLLHLDRCAGEDQYDMCTTPNASRTTAPTQRIMGPTSAIRSMSYVPLWSPFHTVTIYNITDPSRFIPPFLLLSPLTSHFILFLFFPSFRLAM